MRFTFRTIDEPALGPKWKAEFEALWPAYQRWFYREGDARRPSYRASLRALTGHMPEMSASYHHMVGLAGGSDSAARFLAQYCPPPFFAACSQVMWLEDEPVLIRNYDYSPLLCDGLIMRTNWNAHQVIAVTDSMSGVLDGMNESGLAVSLAFGGRRIVGEGFGISLTLRYVLETCRTVAEAIVVLQRIPVHLAYNIALLDGEGHYATVMVAPGEETLVSTVQLSTNHQGRRYWQSYARQIRSHARHRHLKALLSNHEGGGERLITQFIEPPLFSDAYASGYGTVYTAAYFPGRKECRYLWRDGSLALDFESFRELSHETRFDDPAGIPVALPPRATPVENVGVGASVAIGR